MRTTNVAKCKSLEVTEKVIFPDATEQVSAATGGISEAEAVEKVTFENLDDKGDVGTGAAQVAAGDHTHTLTITEALTAAIISTTSMDWTTTRTASIPASAKKVIIWLVARSRRSNVHSYIRAVYNGITCISAWVTSEGYSPVHWSGNGVGSTANLTIDQKCSDTAYSASQMSGAHYITIG